MQGQRAIASYFPNKLCDHPYKIDNAGAGCDRTLPFSRLSREIDIINTKSESMSEVIQGEGFTVKSNKFDFFFGRIASTPDNQRRSLDNLNGLCFLGIEEEKNWKEQLMQIFHEGLNSPPVGGKRDRYGTTIVKKLEILGPNGPGAIEISYLYRDNNLDSIPEVTTLIVKIYPLE